LPTQPIERRAYGLFLLHITKKIISIYDDRIVKRTGSENDFGPYLSQAYNEK